MNSIWNKNLSLFKNRFPQLAQLMENQLEFFNRYAGTETENTALYPFWEITTSRTNLPVAAENGLRLHSAYNPEREAETALAAKKEEITASKALVFSGMGLGYTVLKAVSSYKDKTIIIIEPDLNHFLAALLLVDFEAVFSHPSIIFACGCGTEQAITLLNQYGIHYCCFFSVQAQTAHGQPYFDQLETLIKRNKNKEDINNATLEKFRKLWFNNSKRNLSTTCRLEGVKLFRGKGKDLPFLVLGAGPSLDKILPYLNQLKEKIVTVCVDTALRSCLRVGYQPDFIVLTDPQYWAYRHIAGLKSPSSILIAENAVYPAVFKFNCKKIICCSSQIPLGTFFEKYCGEFGSLGAGGSVASCCWNFAELSGASRIYVAGLDLSFPKKQTHIKGSTFEQASHTNSLKIKSAETAGMPMLFSGNACWEKDYNDQPVLSDQRMKMFAWWFESRLAACPHVKTYTIAPEGLKIPGIQVCAIDELLSLPECTASKQEYLSFAQSERPLEELDSCYKKACMALEKQLQEAINICADAIKNLKSSSPNPELYQSKLSQLEIASFLELVPSTNVEKLTVSERYLMSFKSIAEFCKNF